MSAKPADDELRLLNYIHSLCIVGEKPLGHSNISTLLERGWIRKVWIGNYALTEAGKRARRNDAAKAG